MRKKNPMKTALILVDIQNDYFPGGKGELEGSLEASQQAGRLLDHFRRQGLPPVFIQHVANRPGAVTFLPDTDGVKIHENIRPLPGETIFQKHYPNSFRDTPLLEHLRGLGTERLVICGMMTHMCVDSTVRAAFDFGFDCWLAQDACATRALSHAGKIIPAEYVHLAFLAALNGRYSRVLTVEELIAQL
jgi:nicotinamidase-related amidase